MLSVHTATASECEGDFCDIGPVTYAETVTDTVTVSEPLPMGYVAPAPVAQTVSAPAYSYAMPVPMRSVKMLSVKPVEPDNRPPLWDGTNGKYKARAYDKTVDWRDGVPIWDDSIVNYKSKDFSDWFLEPLPEVYAGTTVPVAPVMPAIGGIQMYGTTDNDVAALYSQTMEEAAETRARVEELLSPRKPTLNLWTDDSVVAEVEDCEDDVVSSQVAGLYSQNTERYAAQDLTVAVNNAFGRADGCPFETDAECDIWRRKPIFRETVSPRSSKITDFNLGAIVGAAQCNGTLSANDPVAAPLLERYKMLLSSARACCADGMAYQLRRAGASDGLIYKFMADDANFYGFGSRCLMMTDAELDAKYPNTSTAVVAADVRNGCLCRGRQWFSAMLAPFQQMYAAMPEFKNQKFYYTYTDGLQRKITVSVNNDVQNVLNQLSLCP